MPELPPVIQTGQIYWKVETDYLPAGATAPLTAPAEGVITIEPMRKSVNVDDTSNVDGLGVTIGFLTRTLPLVDGVVQATIPADFRSEGWNYKVTPKLTVKNDAGGMQPADSDLNKSFAFHLAPGETVDLSDARAATVTPSAGTTTPTTGGTGTTTTPTAPGEVDSSTTFPVIA